MLTDRQKQILTAVNNNNGNHAAAARDLGISRQGVDKQMALIEVKRNKAGKFEGNDVSKLLNPLTIYLTILIQESTDLFN